MTDVILKLPDRSRIPCHTLVLSAASPYFETMFKVGLEESSQEEILVDFSNAKTIKMVIDYFYSGNIEINETNCQDLISASEYLCLTDLKRHLGAFMTSQVDTTNCIDFYRTARFYSLGKLIPHCLEYTVSHFADAVSSTTNFEKLSEDEVIEIICDDRLKADNEDAVFQSVLRWINADAEKRKPALERIISFIRFPFCSQECLSDAICEPLMLNPVCMKLIRDALRCKSQPTPNHFIISSSKICTSREEPRHGYRPIDTGKTSAMAHRSKNESFLVRIYDVSRQAPYQGQIEPYHQSRRRSWG